MEPVQGSEHIVFPYVAAFGFPVFRVLDEPTDGQPDVALDLGKHPDHPAPAADLQVQPLQPVGRGDSLLIDRREVTKRERALEALFQAADPLGETVPLVIDESCGRSPGALFVRL